MPGVLPADRYITGSGLDALIADRAPRQEIGLEVA